MGPTATADNCHSTRTSTERLHSDLQASVVAVGFVFAVADELVDGPGRSAAEGGSVAVVAAVPPVVFPDPARAVPAPTQPLHYY